MGYQKRSSKARKTIRTSIGKIYMQVKPLVTVIIPTYNRADMVMHAIESVRNQQYSAIQLIVIDDGSTDGTRELLEHAPDLEYHYIPNGGQAAARNLALQYANGSLIATLDSDDRWNPDFLKLSVECLETNKLDFVFSNWTQINKVGQPFDFLTRDPFIKPYLKTGQAWNEWILLSNDQLRSLYLVSCPSPSSAILMRKSSIVDGWNNLLRIGEDWSLYLDMILKKDAIGGFTLTKLWSKLSHEGNIYDGRLRSEILEIVVKDDLEIMRTYQNYLRPDELLVLNKKYVSSLTELSKHLLVREKNVKASWNLFKKSLKTNLPYTISQIPQLFLTAVRNRRFPKRYQ